MARIPTVAVVSPDGDRWLINESDFDPERHTLWADRTDPDAKNKGPEDVAERLEAIKGAIAQLDRENPEHFTKGGKPQVEAIEAVLGWNITAAERDAAWESMQGE